MVLMAFHDMIGNLEFRIRVKLTLELLIHIKQGMSTNNHRETHAPYNKNRF